MRRSFLIGPKVTREQRQPRYYARANRADADGLTTNRDDAYRFGSYSIAVHAKPADWTITEVAPRHKKPLSGRFFYLVAIRIRRRYQPGMSAGEYRTAPTYIDWKTVQVHNKYTTLARALNAMARQVERNTGFWEYNVVDMTPQRREATNGH